MRRLIVLLGFVAAYGCTCETGVAGDLDGGPGDGGAGNADAGGNQNFDAGAGFTFSDGGVIVTDEGPDGGTVTFECFEVVCPGRAEPLACADCEDNDGDGLTDFRDPECLGPCDNTEGPGLESGVGGTTATSCGVDCYFDFGNGPGNDKCFWDHRCDELEPEARCSPFEPDRVGSRDCPDTQVDTCAQECRPITPNGCDCFGCCDLGEGFVWIGNFVDQTSTCTLAEKNNPEACPPCTPVENCFNGCGRCELCIGKTEVPDDCFVAPPPGEGEGEGEGEPPVDAGFVNPDQCDPGIQPCGLAGQDPCEQGTFCISGCCIVVGG